MSKKLEVFINYKAVGDLLKSAEMMGKLQELGNGMKGKYGREASLDSYVAQTRAVVEVVAPFSEASKDNALLKAVR